MRVPLIASLPGVIPAGRVASQAVSLTDVAPTALSALGVTVPKPFQGRSFLRLFFSDPTDWAEVPVTMETMVPWHSYGWSSSRAILAENFKYIEAPKPELYDLDADPDELENLYEKNRGHSETLAQRLEALRAGYAESSLESDAGMAMDDETRKRLAALGYVFSDTTSGKPGPEAPDVKDMVQGLDAVLNEIKEASVLHASGREDEGISLLERVLETSPDNRLVRTRLGSWYARKKDFQNAEKHLKRVIQIDPQYIEAYHNLGQLYAEFGHLEDATRVAQAVFSKFPRSTQAFGLMGMVRLQEKNYQGALEYLNQAIEYLPTYHEALVNRAVARYFLGDKERALEDLKEASRIQPENEYYAAFVKQLEEEMKVK
jgi:tetratricopeptide (TPR) repeat protein